MTIPALTAHRLRTLVTFNPQNGVFHWKRRSDDAFPSLASARSWNAKYAGREALTTFTSSGYRAGRIDGVRYPAHRVAWLFVHGEWPHGEVDHINGDRSDNRIANLRDVERSENARNLKEDRRNTSGHRGVAKTPNGTWKAYISDGGRVRHLGTFATFDEAACTRRNAEQSLGYHPNHGRSP